MSASIPTYDAPVDGNLPADIVQASDGHVFFFKIVAQPLACAFFAETATLAGPLYVPRFRLRDR